MCHYNQALSLDAAIMVSKTCAVIGERDDLLKTPLITALWVLRDIFLLSNFHKHDIIRRNFWPS